jgi:hypothetical protein
MVRYQRLCGALTEAMKNLRTVNVITRFEPGTFQLQAHLVSEVMVFVSIVMDHAHVMHSQ